jgi:single-strand DNA-binding protein
VRVTCWRRLAEGVNQSVVTGDPLVVTGRMYTRDWVGDDGQHRVSYELEAVAVGHDLSRGFARFARHRPAAVTSMVEDAEADVRIGDEASVLVASSARRSGDVDDLSVPDVPAPPFEAPSMSDSYGEFGSGGAGNGRAGDDSCSDEDLAANDESRPAADESRAAADAARAVADALDVVRAAGLDGEPDTTGRPGAKRGRAKVPMPA